MCSLVYVEPLFVNWSSQGLMSENKISNTRLTMDSGQQKRRSCRHPFSKSKITFHKNIDCDSGTIHPLFFWGKKERELGFAKTETIASLFPFRFPLKSSHSLSIINA